MKGQVPPLIVRRSQPSPGLALVSIEGEVDLSTAEEVRAALVAAVDEWHPREIQVDLAAVPFMDSMGISALIAGYRAALASEAAFRVVRPSRAMTGLLDITGLLGVFGYESNSSIAR